MINIIKRIIPAIVVSSVLQWTVVPAEAGLPNIKERGQLTITVDLLPPAPEVPPTEEPALGTEPVIEEPTDPAEPTGPSGTAEIKIAQKHQQYEAALKLAATGLPAGSYAIEATYDDGVTIVELGTFDVTDPTPDDADPIGSDVTVETSVPQEIDGWDIAVISVIDTATDAVVLTGETTATTTYWRYFANVRITGTPIVAPPTEDDGDIEETDGPGNKPKKAKKARKPKKIHGHALAHSKVVGDTETRRVFLWVGFGAPASTELTINVDGVPVGTVTSTKNGKVKFKGLPEDVVIRDIEVITLTNADGAEVMKAEF
jgi:hypothetical protein